MYINLKNERNICIWFVIFVGVNYLLIEKIDNMPLKIIFFVVFNVINLIFFVIALRGVYKEQLCPFLNDKRLFNGMSGNPDICYGGNHFCSGADTIDISYEVVDGITRRVSATNQFFSCCMNRGENCPIFQKLSMMNEDELRTFYAKKWNYRYINRG